MRPVVVSRSLELDAPPERVWTFLADTDRVNRLIGVAPLAVTPIEVGAEGRTSARFLARTVAGGFAMTYEEPPFDWSHGRSFAVRREMRSGPLRSYELRWKLEPRETAGARGTHVTLRLDLAPRIGLLRPIVWFNARAIVDKLLKVARDVDAHVRALAPSPFARPAGKANLRALDAALRALRASSSDADVVDRLAELVRDGADADLVRVRPFELADAWGADRRTVLRAFLHAVPAGLFELRWGLVCPSCLVASDEVDSLAHLDEHARCQLCDIAFDLELDRAVEAMFTPHPAIRVVSTQPFCIGGPARTPHVLEQTNLRPGEIRDVRVPAADGRYRVFTRGGAAVSVEVDPDGTDEADVSLGPDGAAPATVRVKSSGTIRVANATGRPRHVKLERLEHASRAATAHVVSTLAEFRALFSSQLLKRETVLKVSRVAILFSDLTGSTALYSAVGDAAAFRLVDDHFDVLRAAVSEAGGTVVKTMGDAVLAAFTDPGECARGALLALEKFARFRAGTMHGKLVDLKLGMYAGPCYAVRANGALDYFGQTVNVASRVQHLAGSGEIVLPEDALAALDPASAARLTVKERFEARVKGVDSPLHLARAALGDVG